MIPDFEVLDSRIRVLSQKKKNLQIMPIENEIVDEAIEVKRPNVVVVGRGPTKLEVEHHVASGQEAWSRGRGPTCAWLFEA